MQSQIEVVPITLDTSRNVSYEELEHNLRRLSTAEVVAAKMVQAHFSLILLQERWREAALWIDPKTKELYPNPYDAPDEIDLVKTDTPRFSSMREWIDFSSGISGFAKSTCYSRHRELIRQMKVLGRSFDDALNSVMLSMSYSKMMLDRLTNDDSGVFLPTEVALLLPEPLQEEADLGSSEACLDVIMSRMRADETRMEGGEDVRNVIKDLRKQVLDKADYRIKRHTNYPNAFIVRREEDGTETNYIFFVEDEDHNPAPPNVINWVASRLRTV
jgi:hypothetical protein